MNPRALTVALALCSFSPVVALAEGLDRDSLLTEAPATPDRGTVRVEGGGNASFGPSTLGGLSATAMWTPFTHFAADVGGYWQDGDAGPTVRLRYQLLSQAAHGADLAVGLRYKSVGFSPKDGELEALVALGRRLGALELALNLVAGTELGGPGFDVEGRALVGVRLLEQLRVGLDGRLQAEVHDELGWKSPEFVSDVALVGGAAVAWLPLRALQVQLLAGWSHARGSTTSGPTLRLSVSLDF